MDVPRAIAGMGLAASVLAAASCTRTYDGSIVPRYTTEVVAVDGGPRLAIREAEVEPPNRRYRFPPPPVVEEPERPAPAIRRRPVRTAQRPLIPRGLPLPRKVECRNETGSDGRVRLVCM